MDNESDKIAQNVLDAMGALLAQMPTKQAKTKALCLLMTAGYNLLRITDGDEFVRGWLESALADVANNPACEFRVPH